MSQAFVILVHYEKPLPEVDAHLEAHRAWLDEHYRSGHFLVSGPREPREGGGVIFAYATNREEVEGWVKLDPFAREGVARHEVIAFRPTRSNPALPLPMGDSQDG